MNIEQLAIEHGALKVRNIYLFDGSELEALAKALQQQSEPQHCTYPDCKCPLDAPADKNWCAKGLKQQQSEPVAEVCALSVDGNENFGEVEWCIKDFKPNFGQKLFTQPPNTVSLEQYNKLLGGIRYALYQNLNDIKPHLRKLIAEAERSDK